jgi:uncharacterized protein (TIGR02246 family)
MSIVNRTNRVRRRRNVLFAAAAIAALLLLVFAGFSLVRTPPAIDTATTSPSDVHQAFAEAFNARDLEGMLALYEPDATVVAGPGEVVNGPENIRSAMKSYLELQGDIRIETVFVIQSGEIALTRSRWEVREGNEVTASSSGTEVMRRGPDGIWRLVIDNPYGGEPLN